MKTTLTVTTPPFHLHSQIMDALEHQFHIVPEIEFGLILGGRNHQMLRTSSAFIPEFPPLDPASNFTRFLPPNAIDTPEDLFLPRLTKVSIQTPRFTR
jgi:ribonuclease HI